MRNIVNINIAKSIELGKLTFSENGTDKFAKLISYFTLIFAIYICYSTYYFESQANKELIIYLIVVPIAFLLYSIYRLAIEKKLLEVKTNFNAETNRKILLEFAKKNDYQISKDSNECLILNKDGYIVSRIISLVIIIQDNKLYLTILKDGFKFNAPTLYSHISTKNELEKYFADFACL